MNYHDVILSLRKQCTHRPGVLHARVSRAPPDGWEEGWCRPCSGHVYIPPPTDLFRPTRWESLIGRGERGDREVATVGAALPRRRVTGRRFAGSGRSVYVLSAPPPDLTGSCAGVRMVSRPRPPQRVRPRRTPRPLVLTPSTFFPFVPGVHAAPARAGATTSWPRGIGSSSRCFEPSV